MQNENPRSSFETEQAYRYDCKRTVNIQDNRNDRFCTYCMFDSGSSIDMGIVFRDRENESDGLDEAKNNTFSYPVSVSHMLPSLPARSHWQGKQPALKL